MLSRKQPNAFFSCSSPKHAVTGGLFEEYAPDFQQIWLIVNAEDCWGSQRRPCSRLRSSLRSDIRSRSRQALERGNQLGASSRLRHEAVSEGTSVVRSSKFITSNHNLTFGSEEAITAAAK